MKTTSRKKKRKRQFFPRAKESLKRIKYEMFVPLVFEEHHFLQNDEENIISSSVFEKDESVHLAYFGTKEGNGYFMVRNLTQENPYQIIYQDSEYIEEKTKILFYPALSSLVVRNGNEISIRDFKRFNFEKLRLFANSFSERNGEVKKFGVFHLAFFFEGDISIYSCASPTKPRVEFKIGNLAQVYNQQRRTYQNQEIKNLVFCRDSFFIAYFQRDIILLDFKEPEYQYLKRSYHQNIIGCVEYSESQDCIFVADSENKVHVYSKILDSSYPAFEETDVIEIDSTSRIEKIMVYNKFIFCKTTSSYRFNIFDLRREEEIFGSFLTEGCFLDNFGGNITKMEWTNPEKKNYLVIVGSVHKKTYHGWRNILFESFEIAKREVKDRVLDLFDFVTQENEEEEDDDDVETKKNSLFITLKLWNKDILIYNFLL